MLTTHAPSDPPEVVAKLWDDITGVVGWDIGANTGESVHRMLPLFGHVHAWEPAGESFEALGVYWGRSPKVSLHWEAVADHDGYITMSARQGPIGTGQLTPDTTGHEPANGDWGDWGPPLEFRNVPCRSVDSLVSELGIPDVIKVDTEGHEGLVLRGANKLLDEGHTIWLIEFHSQPLYWECRQALEASYCRVETIRHPHYQEGSDEWLSHGWLRADSPHR